MRRRDFINLLGGATAAWPFTVRAQQPAMPVIGFVSGASPDGYGYVLESFRRGLRQMGFVEGHNVAIEYRWAEDRYERLPNLLNEFVRRPVSLIFTTGGSVTALAAKAATKTIPIVFIVGADPIASGLVPSLSRPAGNITGVNFLATALDGKRMELLREMVPKAGTIGVLTNPTNPNAVTKLKDIEAAGRVTKQRLVVVKASTDGEITAAFKTFLDQRVEALFIDADAMFTNRRVQLATMARQQSLPTIHILREYVTAGGLMSYGTSFSDAHRQAGLYAGQILKGAKPADLPVMQPTKFELVINLQTATALGLEIPPKLLALADEVIE